MKLLLLPHSSDDTNPIQTNPIPSNPIQVLAFENHTLKNSNTWQNDEQSCKKKQKKNNKGNQNWIISSVRWPRRPESNVAARGVSPRWPRAPSGGQRGQSKNSRFGGEKNAMNQLPHRKRDIIHAFNSWNEMTANEIIFKSAPIGLLILVKYSNRSNRQPITDNRLEIVICINVFEGLLWEPVSWQKYQWIG